MVNIKSNINGLILHSDRGCQYTSHHYRNKLEKLKIEQSFSAKGCPYDNAPMESWHSLLKKEYVYRRIFQDFEEAKISIFQWIEGVYNRKRIHSSLGFLTPQQMEAILKCA